MRILPPPRDLADVVESSFVVREDPASHRSWRVVPDPSAHLMVSWSRQGGTRAMVVGARSTFADIDLSDRKLTVGVRLRPGVLGDLVRERASAFTDRGVPVQAVVGSAWKELAREGVDAGDPEQALAGLLDVVRVRARRSARTFGAVARSSSVASAAQAAGMPLRTFHARARDEIGLSPKLVFRLLRLYRVLHTYRPAVGWAAAAADAGFADQPHLVREVRALLGETPRQWLARGGNGEGCPADPFKT